MRNLEDTLACALESTLDEALHLQNTPVDRDDEIDRVDDGQSFKRLCKLKLKWRHSRQCACKGIQDMCKR